MDIIKSGLSESSERYSYTHTYKAHKRSLNRYTFYYRHDKFKVSADLLQRQSKRISTTR